ncbi:MAG: methylenetetrahydrofolate reductase C-terminal domain-containing protein [Dongiaceae bacterium]
MYAVRLWSVRRSGSLEALYNGFERVLVRLDPLWRRIGYGRLEAPAAAVERGVKGLLFDCRMCGQCVLSSTGMSCPMNCPKSLRNGPCGGVRADGNCEVKPEMKCVWVQAWTGARAMRGGAAIVEVQKPVDHRLEGRSSWLKVVRDKAGALAP